MKHVESSISLLQKLEYSKPYNLGFSGGKDSVVILDLAKKAGVKFDAIYALTTIDPPSTTKFIKENYPEVNIIRPDKTFFKLVKERGLPSRIRRFCCEELKERYGIGKISIEGMRRSEGRKRKEYDYFQCDSRKWMKGAKHILPILDWSDSHVWDYIKENNLPYMYTYDNPFNFSRLGCIGCPLQSKKSMRHEFQSFPKYAYAYINAIKKHMDFKPNNFIAKTFEDEYEAFYFYTHNITVRDFHNLKRGFLQINFQETLKEYLKQK